MGAGKTTHGRKLANLLNLDFVDLDYYIEKKHRATIPYIFDLVGESGFRLIEHRTLKELLNRKNLVLSTGGGTPCFYNNIFLLNHNFLTIYFKQSVEIIVKRLISAKRKRPLVQNFTKEELKSFVSSKLNERENFYNQTKIVIDGASMTTRIIANAVEQYYSNDY